MKISWHNLEKLQKLLFGFWQEFEDKNIGNWVSRKRKIIYRKEIVVKLLSLVCWKKSNFTKIFISVNFWANWRNVRYFWVEVSLKFLNSFTVLVTIENFFAFLVIWASIYDHFSRKVVSLNAYFLPFEFWLFL